jgi:hypothetical protein
MPFPNGTEQFEETPAHTQRPASMMPKAEPPDDTVRREVPGLVLYLR